MKPKLILGSVTALGIELESIDARHLDMLRRLKNKHRARFFSQEEISVEAQQRWYAGYCERLDDWMFAVRTGRVDVGFIGYRRYGDTLDMYNGLRKESWGDGTMGMAFEMLGCYAAQTSSLPIRGRVLADNPHAFGWTLKHGFVHVGEGEEAGAPYVLVEFDRSRIRYVVEARDQ